MLRTLSLLALATAGLMLLTGCQLPTGGGPRSGPAAAAEAALFSIPAGTKSKKVSVGQLRYVTPARAVIGDSVVTRAEGGRFQTDFTTGPGVPLMRVQLVGNEALAEGLFAWGRWRGKADRSGRLSSWTTLREVFAAADAPARSRRSSTSLQLASAAGSRTPWSATVERTPSGQITRLAAEFPQKKERFIFVFAH